ncbi:MAG: DNA mismatch repair protein MutS [Acidobacteriota bacterium]
MDAGSDARKLTPAMRQWHHFKSLHPDKLLLFRMGDFYEMFGDDAVTGSQILEIALTTRDRNKENPFPMCGIPYHALNGYLAKLIRAGCKAAVCEQVEDPARAKGVVRRAVTRVITPGTVLEEGVVEQTESVLLAAVLPGPSQSGLAWADLSSGEVMTRLGDFEEIMDRLTALEPREVLLPEGIELEAPPDTVPTVLPADLFDGRKAQDRLARKLGLPPVLPGIPSDPELLGPLYALMVYVQDHGSAPLRLPVLESRGDYLFMDEATRKNLELSNNMEDGSRRGTLLETADGTRSPLGARLLARWVLAPSARREEIETRQMHIKRWMADPGAFREFDQALKHFPDWSRVVARFGAGIATPRDAGALREALGRLPDALQACSKAGGPVEEESARIPQFSNLAELLESALVENPPPHGREGGIFAPGFHKELDALRDLSENARGALLEVEKRERASTGINSLKIRYNKVFGYFLEVSKVNLGKVPSHYERRQTLVNAERFVTPELKDLENRILTARDERERLEARLWEKLKAEIAPELDAMRDAAIALARLDVLHGFARTASDRGYICPEILEVPEITIEEGRHPVLERDPRHQPFVPNPARLDIQNRQLILLTGPNMGGKSTYLRQLALITVMAHLGSFVPARSAAIGLVDRLFCRVGAGDSLRRGLSTFMMEMSETAAILRNATQRSLVILDEVGRGTSTYDGMAIAWAVAEALLGPDGIGCRSLFATHYHELTELGQTPGVQNLTMGVREHAGKVVFLRTVEEGTADKSYGLHVAELAGIPESVVERARLVLQGLEQNRDRLAPPAKPERPAQRSLFETNGVERQVLEALRTSSIDSMTPLEALNLLHKLHEDLS